MVRWMFVALVIFELAMVIPSHWGAWVCLAGCVVLVLFFSPNTKGLRFGPALLATFFIGVVLSACKSVFDGSSLLWQQVGNVGWLITIVGLAGLFAVANVERLASKGGSASVNLALRGLEKTSWVVWIFVCVGLALGTLFASGFSDDLLNPSGQSMASPNMDVTILILHIMVACTIAFAVLWLLFRTKQVGQLQKSAWLAGLLVVLQFTFGILSLITRLADLWTTLHLLDASVLLATVSSMSWMTRAASHRPCNTGLKVVAES